MLHPYRLFLILVLSSLSALTAGPAKTDKRPNIVWIFSDDHSFQTIGAYGGRLQSLNPTPNIDRLANEGMRFDRCYVANSICGPARATLLTGLHSHLNGKRFNRKSETFDHNQPQFQKILQQHGYQTAMFGKIHLHGQMQGFDAWEVLPGQGLYYDPVFISENGRSKTEGYVSDPITDKALSWLNEEREAAKPFMLMIHHKAPHHNWVLAQRHEFLYEDVVIPEPDNLFDDYANRTTAAHNQDMSIASTMTLAKDLKLGEKFGGPTDMFAQRRAWFEENKPEGEEWELYDLKNDPAEMNSLYQNPKYAKTVKKLKAELARLRKEYQVDA